MLLTWQHGQVDAVNLAKCVPLRKWHEHVTQHIFAYKCNKHISAAFFLLIVGEFIRQAQKPVVRVDNRCVSCSGQVWTG